jgi:hypothetical protein
MEAKRLALHEVLCELMNITEPDGDRHVYFQPPPSVYINYPAIVYSLSGINNSHANNMPYSRSLFYQVTVIDHDPDSVYADALSKLPRCRFDRHYTSDKLNHFVFTLQQ